MQWVLKHLLKFRYVCITQLLVTTWSHDRFHKYIESSTPIGTGPIINSDQMDADATLAFNNHRHCIID